MRHYRFIHFFWHNDLKFYPNFVKTINNETNHLSPKEHLFVTPYKNVFDELSDYDNVVFFDTNNVCSAKMINHFAAYGDWLFLHSVRSWSGAFGIKKKYLKKIIWRTWGHDSIPRNTKGEKFTRIVKNTIVNYVRMYLVRHFYAVGVSPNYIDSLDVKRNFGDVRTVPMSYTFSEEGPVSRNSFLCSKQGPLNILVGHSGYCADNHIAILEKLKRFKKENICIYLIFSYGNSDYMGGVKKYVDVNWPQKVKIITKFMSLSEFQDFCSNMDIAVFDGQQSYAIGCVTTLFSLRKKMIFNRNGLWHKAFFDNDAPHMCSDELDSISFEQLKRPFSNFKEKYEGLDKISYEEHVKNWKKLLGDLKQMKKEKK